MPLDVWIYGPGFGESILLMWDVAREGGGSERRAAFVDCYGGSDQASHGTLCQWRDAGCPRVALACVTHPHLDHLQHAAVVMAAAGCSADKVLWWGGHDLRRTRAFFAQMKEDLTLRGQELGTTAGMVWEFLNDLDALDRGTHRCRTATSRTEVRASTGIDLVLSESTTEGPIEFYAISPWLGPQTAYTKWIDSQIFIAPTGETEVRPNKGVANCASLGFLVKYGKAQVLLGGDMEADNWTSFGLALRTGDYRKTLPVLNPCLIKVSHHASPTGEVAGMWVADRGFFGTFAGDGDEPAHCVITPWRLGDRRWHLPQQNRAVVDRIAAAGCHVWETASRWDVGAIPLN